ncbi:hypothetical protein VNO77_19476 [Canavalia gladiata]|uniref:Uncharacterized protein n=1 Tax=Canavalia gladiata TaxID=3824 RepID=A0AAN9LRL5_CANGL
MVLIPKKDYHFNSIRSRIEFLSREVRLETAQSGSWSSNSAFKAQYLVLHEPQSSSIEPQIDARSLQGTVAVTAVHGNADRRCSSSPKEV